MNNGDKKRILVVDDSTTMRMLITMTIKKIVPSVITEAVNGVDAIGKIEKQDFDLVLTDIMMPEMDGTQLISMIRGSLNREIPIIIITTKGEEGDRDLGLSLGANGYITKPVNGHELKETILKYLLK
ncbi:MAG: response regulator [Nitrospirota bacterium]|mgnify:CR=1 FL=1